MNHWPHSPCHLFNDKGTYMVTSGTYQKQHFFHSPEHLNLLQTSLFTLAEKYGWRLEAWAIFSNHYHLIAQSPENPASLPKWIAHLHTSTARELNRMDNAPGRKVWHQFRDTYLSFHNSYLARLNYVMQNPVKHKLVGNAELYPWCSAGWFALNANRSYVETVKSFKTDELNIEDDF
jgi:putative transposase